MAYYNKKESKLGSIILAVIVLAVLAVGVLLCGYAARDDEGKWFKNPNLSTWHWADPVDDTSEDNIAIVMYSLDAADFEVYGISPQALEAKVITVDFSPENTTDKRVGFDCGWKNPNSEWATGKDWHDYFDFVPAENYGASATLALKQPFGEPFIVTATSRANSALTSSVQYDYVLRYDDFCGGGGEYIEDMSKGLKVFDYIRVYKATPYTVLPDEISGMVKFTLRNDIVDYINRITVTGGVEEQIFELETTTGIITAEEFRAGFGGDFTWENLADFCINTGCYEICDIEIQLNFYYNGEFKYHYQDRGYLELTDGAVALLSVPPTNITINGGGAF